MSSWSWKDKLKALARRSPIALTENNRNDLNTKWILQRALPADAHTVDVGCHKGEILDLILRIAPRGKHRGYEPIPAMAAELRERYARRAGVQIRELALSDKAGTSSFNHVVTNPSYSGLKRRDYDRPGERDEQITVRTARLDDELPAGSRLDLIKIDVEGGELQVLQGAERILGEQRPLVIFEHGRGAAEHYGAHPEAVYDVLAKADLRPYQLKTFLKGGPSLSAAAFRRLYEERLDYYFVAAPDERLAGSKSG